MIFHDFRVSWEFHFPTLKLKAFLMKSFLYERATSVPQLKDSIFFQTPKINFLRRYENRVYYNT
jgi:hypothetical protein